MTRDRKVKRKSNRKPGRLKKRFWAGGLLFLKGLSKMWAPVALISIIFLARYWLLTTPRLGLVWIEDNIKVCKNVERKSLFDFLDIRRGTNLFTIDIANLQKQIMTHHWVKEVRITRQLPDTLVIKITEHQPFALINLGDKYYVNEKGILFAKVGKKDDLDYPVVSGFSKQDFRKGSHGYIEKTKCLQKVVSLIPMAVGHGGISSDYISEVRFDPKEGYGMVLEPEGMVVKLGKGNFAKKMARFKLIYDELGRQVSDVTMIDLGNPERAIIKGLRKVDAG